MATALLAATSAPAQTPNTKLLLAVEINGVPIDKIGEFTLRDGVLFATREELAELGIRVSVAEVHQTLVPLSSLPGLAWTVNEATQTIAISASDESRVPVNLTPASASADSRLVQSGTGATVNYDLTETFANGQGQTSGLLDFRAFSPNGIVSTTVLGFAGNYRGGDARLIRLDTSYSFSDPVHLRQYRIGDFISGALSWTRAVRFGGIQISSDYRVRPDVATFPLPTLSGSAAAPSTIDVLVNGSRVLSQDVASGPFVIPQVPVIDGAGNIAVAVTDAAGRQVVTSVPFYASASLLAPGLQTFSAQAGALRRNFAVRSNDYRDAAISATYRRGLADWLTLEGDLEGWGYGATAGSGVVMKVGNLALVNAAIAIGRGRRGTGGQLTFGVQRASKLFSAGVSVTRSTPSFDNLAIIGGEPPVRLQIAGSIAASLGAAGSVGLGYSEISRHETGVDRTSESAITPRADAQGPLLQPSERFKFGSLSYSVESHGVFANVYAYRDILNERNSGVTFGLTIPFGRRASVSANVGTAGRHQVEQLQALQSAAESGQWGYQFNLNRSQSTQGFAAVEYRTDWSLLRAGIDRSAGHTAIRVNTTGSLSFMDGEIFAGNVIQDSFAIVDTNGLPNVRVLSENREIGRTNKAGRLLVPQLRSFELNHLAINPDDVPPDASIADISAQVRTQDRSGVLVRFPVRPSRSALVRLVDEAGAPIALGSKAHLGDSLFPTGYDGAIYLEGLGATNVLIVEREDALSCAVTFAYRPAPGLIPTIGPLICRVRSTYAALPPPSR